MTKDEFNLKYWMFYMQLVAGLFCHQEVKFFVKFISDIYMILFFYFPFISMNC